MPAEAEISRWWYLDLAADFPDLEIHFGGWKAEQETSLIELGERVMNAEADWLLTWIYSSERDRTWAASGSMFRMVLQRMRDQKLDPEVDPVPAGWYPDAIYYDRDRWEER